MSILATELADYLATHSVGTVGTDIFIGRQPATPNSCVTVIETGGQAPSGYTPLSRPTVQVIVRDPSYETGRAKADAVFAALHQLANRDLGSHFIYFVLSIADIGYLERDENERHEWSMNFRMARRAG